MLSLDNLSVSYGESLIVRDVTLEVRPGEVVCLMGRNGVGKTTLLKCLMGLLPVTAGRVSFGGRDLTKTPPEVRARAGIGYVPQGREIFPHLTVEENLRVGMLANASIGKSRSVPEYIYDYFPILKQFLHRKGGVLSGGQQQQLALARVLVGRPKLLVLDEPTEGIQPSIILLIEKVLERLKAEGEVAVLLVEQYFEFALKLADRYYVMEKGAIVMQGGIAELDKEALKPFLAF